MRDVSFARPALMLGAATPAVAAQNHDAALVDLGRRLAQASDAWNEARQAYDDAVGRAAIPEPPEALFRQPSDTLSTYGLTMRDGRRWYGDEIESLRSLAHMAPVDLPDKTRRAMHIRSARELARRDEIVAADAAWRAAKAAAYDAAGATAAEAAYDIASEATRSLMAEIAACPAATLAGVMVKARAAGWAYGGLDGIADEMAVDEASTGETMALAVLRDLLILAGPDGLPAA